METPSETLTPRRRVEAKIREALASAEVTDLIEPQDPAPAHPEWDFDERFYTPLQVVRACWPFAPERPGVPTLRDGLLESIRRLREAIRNNGLKPADCKAYLPAEHEADAALVYFRLDGYVLAALGQAAPAEVLDAGIAAWNLTLAVNVADEAIPP